MRLTRFSPASQFPHLILAFLAVLLGVMASPRASAAAPEGRLKVLFLGDDGKREPAQRMTDLVPPMLDRDIEVVYSESFAPLTSEILPRYNAILLFGDQLKMSLAQEKALVVYVKGGGGLISVHTGGLNFPKSAAWEELIGARSDEGKPALLAEQVLVPGHPLMKGYQPLKAQDVILLQKNGALNGRTVLSEVKLADGTSQPWTWVRTYGEGRVFFTGWGGTLETWLQADFVDLMERAIRWTAGQDVPKVLAMQKLNKPFKRIPAKIAYNPPRNVTHPNIRKKWNDMQLPLSPEESMRRMITPAGFEVQLFAAEPDIRKPMAMAWDHRGRLWVAETTDYPNALHPDGEGNDRISICEDTDGDGKADKFTVFAEGLNIPTGLTLANGGVIVVAAPRTLFLKDTDGDDKADVRQTLFEGWGLKDSHAGPNGLEYGLDNWIWGVVGYSGFYGKVGGKEQKFGNGLYRFDTAGGQFDFLYQGFRNMHGLGFTTAGDVFSSGANGAPSMAFSLPNRYYDRVPALKRPAPSGIYRTSRGLPVTRMLRQWDGYGIYTACVGHHLYGGDVFPQEYRENTAFVNDPTLGVVGAFKLTPDHLGWHSVNSENLLASDDEWFSPIQSKTGPDGALWVIDWYNYIVQHNPSPGGYRTGSANAYVTEQRDKTHGRIYRVVYTGGKGAAEPKLALDKPENCVAALAHPNRFWRMQAQRLLVERGKKDVVPAIAELITKATTDSKNSNVGAIHACWTLRGLGALANPASPGFSAVVAALKHPAAMVRRNAAESLVGSPEATAALISSGMLRDQDPQARLAALRALADQPASAEAGKALVDVWPEIRERAQQAAALAAAFRHEDGVLAALKGQEKKPAMEKLLMALKAKPKGEKVDPYAKDRVVVKLGVQVGKMKYDQATLEVKSGSKVRLVFSNTDLMEHNLVIIKPGSKARVGALADKMAATAEGAKRQYIPKSPDVLWASPLLDPGQSHEILFTAPKPGKYPFICTFPGHWRIMFGTMIVK